MQHHISMTEYCLKWESVSLIGLLQNRPTIELGAFFPLSFVHELWPTFHNIANACSCDVDKNKVSFVSNGYRLFSQWKRNETLQTAPTNPFARYIIAKCFGVFTVTSSKHHRQSHTMSSCAFGCAEFLDFIKRAGTNCDYEIRMQTMTISIHLVIVFDSLISLCLPFSSSESRHFHFIWISKNWLQRCHAAFHGNISSFIERMEHKVLLIDHIDFLM